MNSEAKNPPLSDFLTSCVEAAAAVGEEGCGDTPSCPEAEVWGEGGWVGLSPELWPGVGEGKDGCGATPCPGCRPGAGGAPSCQKDSTILNIPV